MRYLLKDKEFILNQEFKTNFKTFKISPNFEFQLGCDSDFKIQKNGL